MTDHRPDLAELERLAEEAIRHGNGRSAWQQSGALDDGVSDDTGNWVCDTSSPEEAAYIAAADPATVQWLVQRARDAERHEEAQAARSA